MLKIYGEYPLLLKANDFKKRNPIHCLSIRYEVTQAFLPVNHSETRASLKEHAGQAEVKQAFLPVRGEALLRDKRTVRPQAGMPALL
jgi:hypothetical protein